MTAQMGLFPTGYITTAHVLEKISVATRPLTVTLDTKLTRRRRRRRFGDRFDRPQPLRGVHTRDLTEVPMSAAALLVLERASERLIHARNGGWRRGPEADAERTQGCYCLRAPRGGSRADSLIGSGVKYASAEQQGDLARRGSSRLLPPPSPASSAHWGALANLPTPPAAPHSRQREGAPSMTSWRKGEGAAAIEPAIPPPQTSKV